MNIRAKDAKTVFYLARYAERVFSPMVRELETVGAALSIDVTLGDMRFADPWHLSVKVHWTIAGMGILGSLIASTEGIDREAEKFREIVDRKLAELAEQVAA